ncbi:MAG: hypothetical protein HY508_09165 [Acidobacteria bacterium]|nr:hypothetical protein [Acidobacteriota bacterium]
MMNYDSDEHLFNRIVRLARHWRWILGGTVLCAATALVVSLFLPKIYRATTYLMVSESKIGPSSREVAWQQITTINTYIPIVDNDVLIEKQIRSLHLDARPYNLSVESFRRKDYLDVSIPKASRLLEVNVEFPDAILAAALANGLAAGSEDLVEQMNARDTRATQEFLKRRLDQAQAHQEDAQRQRLQALQAGHLEDLEKQLSILLNEKEQLSGQNLQLSLGLAQNQSKSTTLQEALRKEPQTFRLTKSVISNKFLDRLTEQRHTDQSSPLSITEESLNTTGEEIRRDLINATASAAAETSGIQVALNRLKKANAEIEQLSLRITQARNEVERANHEFKMAQEAVESAARDYRNASVTVSAKSDELKQVAPALVPERPIRPRLLLNTLLGGFLGLVLLTVAAALLESVRDLRAKSIHFVVEEEPVAVERS